MMSDIQTEAMRAVTEQQQAPPEPAWEEVGRTPREVNVSMAERMGSIVAGAGMVGAAVYFVSRERPVTGTIVGIVGGILIQRGASGHCSMYEAMGVQTSDTARLSRRFAKPISIEESVVIDRSPEELYGFWRDFKNLPRVMRHLERVDVLDGERSRWIAQGPGGELIAWEARTTHDRPNELIAWETTENAQVPNRGSVRFRPASGHRGTIVEVMMEYTPPGGRIGVAVAKLFGREPSQEIREDLAWLKAQMEAGERPTVEGQPRGTCRAGW